MINLILFCFDVYEVIINQIVFVIEVGVGQV